MSNIEKKNEQPKLTPAEHKMAEVFSIMNRRQGKFEDLLPPWMPAERFVAGAKMAMATMPELIKCTPESILTAMFKAAKAGIDVSGGFLGHGALVPFGTECTFVPMVKGLVALAVNTGVVQDMTPLVVHAADFFEVIEGDAPQVVHKPFVPRRAGDLRGDIIATYTRVTLPSGLKVVKGLLYLDDIARIENGVRAKGGPWGGPHRTEMVKKSSIKNAIKTVGIPSSDQAQYLKAALEADTEAEGYDVEGTVVSSTPVQRGSGARLRQLAQGGKGETLELSPEPEVVSRQPGEEG